MSSLSLPTIKPVVTSCWYWYHNISFLQPQFSIPGCARNPAACNTPAAPFSLKHAIPPLTYLFHSLSHFSHSHSLTLKTCSLTLSLSLTKNMQSLPWRTSSTKNVQSLPWLTSTADQKHAIPQLTSTAGASCPKAAKTRARRDSSWSCWAEKRTCVNRLGHHNLTYWMFILEGLPALRTGPDVQGFGRRSRKLTALKLSISHPTHNTPAEGLRLKSRPKAEITS